MIINLRKVNIIAFLELLNIISLLNLNLNEEAKIIVKSSNSIKYGA